MPEFRPRQSPRPFPAQRRRARARPSWPNGLAAAGVRAAALTDHDTIEGLPAFREAAGAEGRRLRRRRRADRRRSAKRGEAHPRVRLRSRTNKALQELLAAVRGRRSPSSPA
ncbi:MAG: hypothetical protein MZW92_62240 [Comamonadaceae bacterium]|nr:hypothetical protein [Comamonadaceae bacterium]